MEQPDFYYTWMNRGVHCFMLQNYQGALANFTKALTLKSDDWKATYDTCQIQLMLGNLTACRELYKKALTLKIDGREKEINNLMARLDKWITEIEEQSKESKEVKLDLGKFDMQR